MATVEQEEKAHDPEEDARQERIERMPPLSACYNLLDFETVARSVMKKTAWAYYSSGADDEIVRTAAFVFFGSGRKLISPTDYAREPPSLPEDLVPAPSSS